MRREDSYGSLRASRFVERASAARLPGLGSDLDFVHQTAIDGKAGGKQRAPKAAAGVECCRKTAKVEARMLRAEAAHHPAVAAVGAVEGGKAAAAPPETVFLGLQRPLGLEAGVYEQQSPALVPGRSEEHTSELQSLMRISYA